MLGTLVLYCEIEFGAKLRVPPSFRVGPRIILEYLNLIN